MRLHRIVGAGLLATALALFNAPPVGATTSATLFDHVDAARGTEVLYNASAGASTSEHYDARRSNDIVGTSMRFDTNLLNVTIETQGDVAIQKTRWAVVDFSFNKSDAIDGTVIAGAIDDSSFDPSRPPAFAINRLGVECGAMARVIDSKITLSVDATCMGHPGAVSYRAMFGDFMAASAEAVDFSPADGSFTSPVSEPGGYWLLGADGGVFSFGDAQFFGSTGSLRLNKPVVAMSAQPKGDGYRFVASDGGIFAYGSAGFYGSMGGKALNKPVVGMATTASGNGYWLVASDGGIFAFGDAAFYGSTGSLKLNKPIVGMAPTTSGKGYWMVASDGGIFAFGDAAFYGSTGSLDLLAPITAMAATDNGYRLLAADGGVFAFGNASFLGSGAGRVLSSTMALASQPTGYLMADDIGGVYEVGPVFHFGDLVDMGVMPNQPIVGMAVLP